MMDEMRIDPTIAYDVVELPSRGIHYKSGKKSVRVAYLTAADENILASPNLVAQKMVIEELLKRKVLDRDLPTEEIVEEDRQAILIFLRNTAFGTEYRLSALDPKTREDFEVTIDLSTIRIKDFDLDADENGEYKYFLPLTKVPVTFKFLTQKQEQELINMEKGWEGEGIAPVKTKKLEMMIKSVDGIRDQMQIRSFIHDKMPLKDSQEFQKFVNDKKPGLDLTQVIETPSKEKIRASIGFGVEFFRPFYGLS